MGEGESSRAYRHFRDRDELLASVALRGFERFAIVLENAWDDGRPQPFAALDRLGTRDFRGRHSARD